MSNRVEVFEVYEFKPFICSIINTIMYNQHRILKVLKAIALLKVQPPKSIKLLAKQLETTERTLYRYIDLIKELGFEIKKDTSNRVFIAGKNEGEPAFFTNEEAFFLKSLLLQFGNSHILKDAVLRKITIDTEIHELGEQLVNVHLGKIIENLNTAMSNKTQVILKKYFSVHSNTISDRRVEPFQFTDNYHYLCAFEPESKKNKFFAVERIKEVKMTSDSFQFSAKHLFEPIDIFGFSCVGKQYTIDILLNMRAYVLLKEEYPNILPHIQKGTKTYQYRLRTTINNLKPIARFVKGLPNDVEVKGSDELIQYLQEY